MEISVASYSFHGLLADGRMDIFNYLETQRYRYGLHTADIWNAFLHTTEESYLRKVKVEMDARSLKLVNVAVDGAHIWDIDETVRVHHRQNALAHLRAAHVLGARSVRIDMGGRESDVTEEQFEEIVYRYREYAQMASEWGIMVGPENHFGPSLVPGIMKRIAQAVEHPSYGILLHMGRWKVDVDQGDTMCAPWTMHAHVDAQTINKDLEGSMRVLLSAGYRGCWGVEMGEGKHEYENAAWGIAAIQRALSHIEA